MNLVNKTNNQFIQPLFVIKTFFDTQIDHQFKF